MIAEFLTHGSTLSLFGFRSDIAFEGVDITRVAHLGDVVLDRKGGLLHADDAIGGTDQVAIPFTLMIPS